MNNDKLIFISKYDKLDYKRQKSVVYKYIFKNNKNDMTFEFFTKGTLDEIYLIIATDNLKNKVSSVYSDKSTITFNNFINTIYDKTIFRESFIWAGKLDKAAMFPKAISIIAGALIDPITLFWRLEFLGKYIAARRVENEAEFKKEQELNQIVFKGQNKEDSAFEAFRDLSDNITSVIEKKSLGLIIYGKPGSSKTYMTKRTLYFSGLLPGSDYVVIKGSSAKKDQVVEVLYSMLFENNGKIIIFDDFDSIFSSEDSINLLKAALDSYPIRLLSLPSLRDTSFTGDPLPRKFDFTGRIIIITNKTEIDLALSSRIPTINIDYSLKEYLEHIENLLEFINPGVNIEIKREVYDYIQALYIKNKHIKLDLRRFSIIVDYRVAFPTKWKTLANDLLK
jgi:hypothetical protein